jgi:hypothetical protein
VKVRGVGRQKQELTAFGFNGLSHPLALVDTQIIHMEERDKARLFQYT